MIRPIVLVIAACALAVGCSRPPAPASGVAYRLGDQDGRLSMTIGQLTLVFESIPADASATGKEDRFPTPTDPGVMGGGGHDVGGVSIKHKEANMVCTITVNGAIKFELIEGGAKLVLGGKTFQVGEAQTIRVSKDGTPL